MGTLLTDPCCLVGLGAAGLVVAAAGIAAIIRGGQMLVGRLASRRAGMAKVVNGR